MLPPKDNSVVVAKGLSFVLPSGEVLFSGVDIVMSRGEKIVIVGKNGAGKSTLMKIVAGIIQSPTGSIVSHKSAYVDQLDEGVGARGDMSILDLLNSVNEDWWQLQVHYEKLFSSPLPDLSRNLKQLSGGEYTRLKLAIATFNSPELLLLDEPTNHLDIFSKQVLSRFITSFTGAVLVISHDIDFINQVADGIWELDSGKIYAYGGNYQDYLHSKSQIDASKQKRLTEALKEVEKSEWALVREEKRAARSQRHGRSLAGDRSMSSVEKGFFKNKASAASGRKKEVIGYNIAQAKERVEANATPKKKIAKLDLYEGDNKTGRVLLDIRDTQLLVGDEALVKDINFEIKFGDRVLLIGENGCGKTSFIKSLLDDNSPNIRLSGPHIFRVPNLRGMYISQRYDQIDRQKTLLQNIYSVNPNLDLQVARRALGNLLFIEKHDIEKRAESLSGGETARLAFAMASVSPSDLLVLDEPTNNLDVDTIEVVVRALSQFTGAILVVSHDINFLRQIEITQSFQIKDKKLSRMSHLPSEEGFYQEILGSSKPSTAVK